MSEQPLDLRRSSRLVRQHWRAVCAIAALGLVAGVVYTELKPPVLTSTALVRIASPKDAYSGWRRDRPGRDRDAAIPSSRLRSLTSGRS